MTDRIKGFYVVLDHDMREDDAEPLLAAVRCMRNVAAVEVHVDDTVDWMAKQRVRSELRGRIYQAVREAFDD